MKKMLALAQLCVATLVGVAVPAAADVGFYGTWWDGDLGDTYGYGLRIEAGDGPFRFDLRGSVFPDLTSDLDYLFGEEEPGLHTIIGYEALVVEAGFNFNFAPEAGFQPYLGAGASWYLLESDTFEFDDGLGFYGMAGFSVGFPRLGPAFFVEAAWHEIETSGRDGRADVDLDLSGLALNAGLMFRF